MGRAGERREAPSETGVAVSMTRHAQREPLLPLKTLLSTQTKQIREKERHRGTE